MTTITFSPPIDGIVRPIGGPDEEVWIYAYEQDEHHVVRRALIHARDTYRTPRWVHTDLAEVFYMGPTS